MAKADPATVEYETRAKNLLKSELKRRGVTYAGLAEKLAASNPEALSMLKKVFWEGTEHWDELLSKRAEMSGKLVLSEFTKAALAGYAKA